ncbi:MAG: hypothetical protein MUF66_09710 [Gammaproteobacteria bacterium]|jgi:hypothetical protein|nr:hypothetical protein [Gammaproteobacteria bacterium]
MSAQTRPLPAPVRPTLPLDDDCYPEEVLRSAWNPDLEQAGRLHLPPRGGNERWPGPPPTAWVEGLLEEIGSL